MTSKSKKAVSILIMAALVLASVAIFLLVGKPLVSFASNPQAFREWIEGFGIWSRLVFIAIVVLQVVVAIIPGEPIEIAAGYAFGGFEGTVLSIAGITLGSIIIFLLVRKFGVKLVEVFFSREKINSLGFLKDNKKVNVLFFVIMAIPGTPKDLISYFAPLTNIKLVNWVIITTVARIPSVVTSTISGSALGEKKYLFALIAFAVTGILSGAGYLIYSKISKAKQNKKDLL